MRGGRRTRFLLASSALLIVGCSESRPERVQAEPSVAPAGAGIQTGVDCVSTFRTPSPGLSIVLDGRTAKGDRDRYGYEYSVVSVNGDIARIRETMLVGDARSPGPSDDEARRSGFVFVNDGADRRYNYRDLSDAAIQSMKPGEVLTSEMTEDTDFGREAGKGQARGIYRVRFEGCSTIDVAGVAEPVKVFEVVSVARAYDSRATGGPVDRTVEVTNRYWIGARLGLELRRDMSGGSMVATAIREAG